MYLHVPAINGMAVLNALSEQFVVSTMNDGPPLPGRLLQGLFSDEPRANDICKFRCLPGADLGVATICA
jgi:hypothetical protein